MQVEMFIFFCLSKHSIHTFSFVVNYFHFVILTYISIISTGCECNKQDHCQRREPQFICKLHLEEGYQTWKFFLELIHVQPNDMSKHGFPSFQEGTHSQNSSCCQVNHHTLITQLWKKMQACF